MIQQERCIQYSNIPARSRPRPERIELPSIRQAIPEIGLRASRTGSSESLMDHASYSPRSTRIWETSTDQSSSDANGKRRRVSRPEDRSSEPRDYPVSIPFQSPELVRAQSVAPSPVERRSSGYFIGEQWIAANRDSGYKATVLPVMRSPPRFESPTAEFRPTLPSLPSLTLEGVPPLSSGRGDLSEYTLDPPRSSPPMPQFPGPMFRAPSSAEIATNYNYDRPRGQSYPGPTVTSHSLSSDRPIFASRTCFPDQPEAPDVGTISEATRSRKRRGNLPKETTDKLRAWFVAHLHHPYPTEDEKQDLMRQTKLQMNQISNWFINARRRQLPTMIINARVESDARSARSAPVLSADNLPLGLDREISEEERRNMGGLTFGLGAGMEVGISAGSGSGPESGSEGDGVYDDDFEALQRTRSAETSIF